MTEDELLSDIIELAGFLGWESAHFRPAQTGRGWRTAVQGTMGKGWLDLVLANPRQHRLAIVELKSDAGRLSVDQERVRKVLDQVMSTTVQVWRPDDWTSGRIEAFLR